MKAAICTIVRVTFIFVQTSIMQIKSGAVLVNEGNRDVQISMS